MGLLHYEQVGAGHCLYEPPRIFPGVEWPSVITSASMLFRGECGEHTIISSLYKGVSDIPRNTILAGPFLTYIWEQSVTLTWS